MRPCSLAPLLAVPQLSADIPLAALPPNRKSANPLSPEKKTSTFLESFSTSFLKNIGRGKGHHQNSFRNLTNTAGPCATGFRTFVLDYLFG
ncbi:hypothetical protein GGS20DRAFT_411728 [Poronia punctata]|nr:hypothetical protein GGS20DRAFT_411728 [Poronia punctata]